MPALRGALPLFLTGSTGLALVGFGLTGLSGVDPELQRAATTVKQERLQRQSEPTVVRRLADCPPEHDASRRAAEI